MTRLAIGLSLLLAAGTARADKNQQAELIARARTEMGQLNYDAAIALLEQAEASGQNGRDQVIEIRRAIAESHAAMGRAEAAEVEFRRLLALDPSIELPAGSSPKLTAPFSAAREFLAGRVIAIECRSGDGEATLVVKSDPVDLVAGGRLTGNGESAVGTDARGQGRIRLAMPAGG